MEAIERNWNAGPDALHAAILAALALDTKRQEIEVDAARFRALMRCPRIKMQGSAGVDPVTGALKYPDQPGSVHFGAEFWPTPARYTSDCATTWGHHALRALADDIMAVEALAEQRAGLACSGDGV